MSESVIRAKLDHVATVQFIPPEGYEAITADMFIGKPIYDNTTEPPTLIGHTKSARHVEGMIVLDLEISAEARTRLYPSRNFDITLSHK